MAKLKPLGIPPEDQEEPYEKIIPDRVQKLIDLYRKNHVEYPWTQMDKNEQNFEYRRSPSTYKYRIEGIHRVLDQNQRQKDRSKEYYFYQVRKRPK